MPRKTTRTEKQRKLGILALRNVMLQGTAIHDDGGMLAEIEKTTKANFSPPNGFDGTLMDRPEENLQDIRRQLDEAKKEFDQLEMKRGESLRDFEYRVKRHSDKLLSLEVAEKVQRQLLEQDARNAEEQLKKKTS